MLTPRPNTGLLPMVVSVVLALLLFSAAPSWLAWRAVVVAGLGAGVKIVVDRVARLRR